MILLIILIILSTPALFAQEASTPWQNNHYSMGINAMLLAEPNTIIFKKWNNNNKGYQIIIGNETGLAANKDLQKENSNSDEVFEAQVPSIEYVYLVRTNIINSNSAYVYSGFGISFAGYYLYSDLEAVKQGNILGNLRFPIGIEHSFLKSMPFISYSVEADFYAGYWKQCYDTGTIDNTRIGIVFGVTPRFFINWYFK